MQALSPDLKQDEVVTRRTAVLFREQLSVNHKRTDRMFGWLMVIQWLAGIVAALWISPKAWEGQYSHTHIHVWAAIFLGGIISGFPVFMAATRPGSVLTRHVIAVGQMLSCGLLIHLTGGRIESHFQYFGALAFLSFYRDWRVLVTASVVAATDHFVRGMFWPQSIFGVLVASWWRWIEHVGWVLFEDTFLVLAIRQSVREMRDVAERQAKLEFVHGTVERTVDERTVELRNEIAERKRTEEQLRESEGKFRQLAENINDVFWMTSPDLQEVLYVSPAYERVWGRPVAKAYGKSHEWSDAIIPEDRDRVFASFGRLMEDEASASVEFQISRPNGEVRWIHSRGFQVRDAAGKVIRLTGIASDTTARKQFEAQLFQSQKLETVGRLSGGIAHEFNSILTAILGQCEMLLADLPSGSPSAKSATEIRQAAGRAATLTRQLLAYGRKQFLKPETLDLNKVIAGMEGVFHHLMGGEVTTQIVSSLNLQAVKADAGQIEQVIMNMAINARDAMPNGGRLTLETANVSIDEESVGRYPELKAGKYVMLAITDTGAGMSEQVKARLFEPFFTTKVVGEGTGLGLSSCDGIIKQSGGHISVYSERGRGTTFKIYLPQVEQQAKTPIKSPSSLALPRGIETILLVEDDPALREMAETLLTRLGYKVWAAPNGVEALSLKQQRNVGHIDLLFTDVVMPHMSGKELADRVRLLYPHTKILFTSAYTENANIHQGILDKGVALLQKPYTPSALAKKLRELLDQPVL
jgi:PAS domain S-box-containing protein